MKILAKHGGIDGLSSVIRDVLVEAKAQLSLGRVRADEYLRAYLKIPHAIKHLLGFRRVVRTKVDADCRDVVVVEIVEYSLAVDFQMSFVGHRRRLVHDKGRKV